MSEDSEEACLVRPRSPTSLQGNQSGTMPYTDGPQNVGSGGNNNNNNNNNNNGGGGVLPHNNAPQTSHTSTRGSQSHESESGELIDYNDEVVLSQFHADAIKQAGFGKFQLIASLVTGLGLTGHAIQVHAIFYILPSAEVEYCILDHEKNWLGSITLMGLGVGALLWGGLSGRTGRRKALLSCLAVSGVFSVIAAFMPTYGPFMMARFCAAAGIGGVLPAASSYLSELTPSNSRARVLGLLGALGATGGLIAGGLAVLTVPSTGQALMLENKEHFSAWHRYLLLSTIPTIIAILGLFWLPESPRFLLENGREVEALTIYQKIYRNNRTRGGYSLTELELPGARAQRNTAPASVLAGMAHSINMFCGSFIQIFKKSLLKTTILLLITWTSVIFFYHGLTIYIAQYSRNIESETYNRQTTRKDNVTYENTNFNTSIDNVIYSHCRFVNCTFKRLFISHVKFNNCSFMDSEFSNVKTSRTLFQDSVLQFIRLIDTDLTERHFKDCTVNNITEIRLSAQCDRDFEFNIYLDSLWRSHLGALVPSIIAMSLIGEAIHRFGRSRMAAFCFIMSTILCITLGFLTNERDVIWTGGTAQGLALAGLAAATVLTIESYTTPLRCTALGLFVCGGHMGALLAAPLYTIIPTASSKLAAFISAITMFTAVLTSFKFKDPCLLL